MDYLARESSPFEESFWQNIDKVVVETASRTLIGRRFLSIYGPLGAGAISVQYDKSDREEVFEDGFVKTSGRKSVELPQIYQDFTLLWRDLENNISNKLPLDLSIVSQAAQTLANKEDNLIFNGNDFLELKGILNAEGVQKLKISDWGQGENPYTDIVKAINMIREKGIVGRFVLCLSQSLYFDLQRIQQGTGMTEAQRISSMIGNLYNVPVIQGKKAALICSEPQYMDLAVGIDMSTAYLEQKDLNHSFRIMETIIPRIKDTNAIVVLE
ncbi:family 1 encapsulin nanocompartment shell protein [Brachyspira pulli]|uniref:family 1 encapsulin nanocompartment shell protein n=1 Tax=Brachyspira pulli TaxID=310721 RepID=UPI003003CE02